MFTYIIIKCTTPNSISGSAAAFRGLYLQDGSEHSERPHVGGVRDGCECEDLGRAVVDGREQNAHCSVGVDTLCNTEVDDLDVMRLGRRQQHVLRLQATHILSK